MGLRVYITPTDVVPSSNLHHSQLLLRTHCSSVSQDSFVQQDLRPLGAVLSDSIVMGASKSHVPMVRGALLDQIPPPLVLRVFTAPMQARKLRVQAESTAQRAPPKKRCVLMAAFAWILASKSYAHLGLTALLAVQLLVSVKQLTSARHPPADQSVQLDHTVLLDPPPRQHAIRDNTVLNLPARQTLVVPAVTALMERLR